MFIINNKYVFYIDFKYKFKQFLNNSLLFEIITKYINHLSLIYIFAHFLLFKYILTFPFKIENVLKNIFNLYPHFTIGNYIKSLPHFDNIYSQYSLINKVV